MVSSPGIRALLVEDNPGDATLTRCLLAELLGSAIDTSCAERLSTAVNRLKEETFDVVILDLLLPDASRLEGLRQIVRLAPAMPVVILTGRDEYELASDAFGMGAQEFLVKGVALSSDLGRAVHKAIGRKRAEPLVRWSNTNETQLIADDDIISTVNPAHILVVDATGTVSAGAIQRHAAFFVFHEASTWNDTLQALARRHYDAILLEPHLPDAWAIDVYQRLLAISDDIPIIALNTSEITSGLHQSTHKQPFALVWRENNSSDLLRRLLISATLRSRALETSVDAAVGNEVAQPSPNIWRH